MSWGCGIKKHKVIFDDCTGDNVCCKCGSVFYNGIHDDELGIDFDRSFYFHDTNIPNNYGSSAFAADFSLTGLLASKIDESYKDFTGKRIKDPMSFKKLIYINKFLVNPEQNNDKSKRNAMRTIIGVAQKLNLPDYIIERAAGIYRKAYKQNAVRGRSTRGLSIASVFYACKEAGIIRNPEDFIRAIEEDGRWRNELFSNYKTLISILDLRSPDQIKPELEIPHIAGKCYISERTVRKALDVYHRLRDDNETLFFGKSPIAIAVCCLYIASKYTDEEIRQDAITTAGEVSTVTLRKRCDEYITILELLGDQIPQFFVDLEYKKLEALI